MRLFLFVLLLVTLSFSSVFADHNKCPSSPYFDVAPSDITHAKDLSAEELAYHSKYMQIAIDVAIENNSKFAAAIVHKNGTLMCTGVNVGGSRMYHGEVKAIMNCTNMYQKATWEDYSLYTTGEPCPMCSAAIMWTLFQKVIFASYVSNMYCERCFNQLPMDSNEIFKLGYGINHDIVVIGGVMDQVTDTFFPSVCNQAETGWGVTPLCQKGWSRECPRPSRYFGN
ncbi:hypothetical protein RB653_010153 [Dictyostelium firmibasis]|uniref:CMP/dCMP-type deaminase domain-containing protein n=1 Tax=Dictyostelium firmibasis TaxID=79012 RepID=A0AAN7TL48_9MYCE